MLAARAVAAPNTRGRESTELEDDIDDALDERAGSDLPDAPLDLARDLPSPVDPRRAPTLGFAVPVPAAHLEPPIPADEVVAAAYRAAGLDGDPAHGWRVRTRIAALIPWISIHAGRDATWYDVDDPTLDYTDVYDVRATWHLDRLVFDPNEMRIEAMSIGRRHDRRLVAAAAIHSYYEWLELAAAAGTSARWATRADEVKAELDAMTDGWFSKTLAVRPAAGQTPKTARSR